MSNLQVRSCRGSCCSGPHSREEMPMRESAVAAQPTVQSLLISDVTDPASLSAGDVTILDLVAEL